MSATKKRGLNIIKNKHIAYYLAIVLILISLLVQVVEFIAVSMLDRFLLENLFAFLFEIVTNGFLIYALITKNNALIEVSLIVLKVFEGTYYPLRSFQRLDTLIYGGGNDFYIVSHILFASAAFSLLLALTSFAFIGKFPSSLLIIVINPFCSKVKMYSFLKALCISFSGI